MDALPCNAAVEVQPGLADPSTSMIDDSDDEPEDAHVTQSSSDGRPKHGVMAGWIGRLRNDQHSAAMTVAGSLVKLDSSALWAHGRLCRCLLSVAFASASTPASELHSLDTLHTATATHAALFEEADVLAPEEAVAIADRAVTLLKRHLDSSGIQSSGLASLKAYHVGLAGVTLAHALQTALRRSVVDNIELCSLPVFAVGMSSAVSAFLLVECTATVTRSYSAD